MHRFYLDPWPEAGQTNCELSGPEARHAVKVLRVKPGEQILCFDGAGSEGTFEILEARKDRLTLGVVSLTATKRPAGGCVLAMGFAKAARRSFLLEKAVELEAEAVWFWQAERSQGKVPPEPKETWQGQLLAGAKQSGNMHLPRLATLPSLEALLEQAKDFSQAFFLYEDADSLGASHLLSPADFPATAPTLCVLGPEGGFSPREAELLARELTPVSLGKRILRLETAALVCLTLAFHQRQTALLAEPPA